ncbi:MAG: ATP-binding protein [Pseudomonadota bacterium]
MHEILVISGKGGTGKTSLTAAFAHLSADHIICDLDVDAPDLHLLLSPDHALVHEFWSGHAAVIAPDRCSLCGQCQILCRYGAVFSDADGLHIDDIRCEGCKVCVALCPEGAIDFIPKQCGKWYQSGTRFGPMVHAQLFPAEENSGLLVSLLRRKAKEMAAQNGFKLILSDGPPGIGCPVISALSGQDLAVIVTEPTPSGRHDLERVITLCRHFNMPMAVIINKWDLSPEVTAETEAFCMQLKVPVVARLPHDPAFTHAMVAKKAITEFADSGTGDLLKDAWQKILSIAKATNHHGVHREHGENKTN